MPAKPRHLSEYPLANSQLAERVLLEVWSRLGEYREHLVLIGGLAPRYIIPQVNEIERHAGTMDVDLGIAVAVAQIEAYRSIRSTLLGTMDFRPGLNDSGNEQKHSFYKVINGVKVSIDFLTTKYNGPVNSLMRTMEDQLSAIQVEGLGLAFKSPLRVKITGELLSGGITEQEINICRALPFVVLKALALENRGENKDAYDLVYVLKNYEGGPAKLARDVTTEEKLAESFVKARIILTTKFQSINRDGPVKYSLFVDDRNRAAEAFATVQDFLENL
jgi:predicted nucleotidyltransferase